MGKALSESGEVRLANISQAKVSKPIRMDCGSIFQWLVPFERTGRNGLPSTRTIRTIQKIVAELKPDLIHVWGTENYWGLITARGLISGPSLLEMQGIKYACAPVYYGGLSLTECMRCIGPLEILRPSYSLFLGKVLFEKWGRFEKEMILGHKNISTQSDWVRSHVKALRPGLQLFKTGLILRKDFYEAHPWSPKVDIDHAAPNIFTISSGATAYKGLHVLFRSIAILKYNFPHITLNIAGAQIKPGIRMSGYARWLKREIRHLNIEKNINWLGPMNSNGIIEQIQRSSVIVIPSFVESYSVALAEAMQLGAPLVVSFSGAMPELARNEESALFFSPGDSTMCARSIEQILNDQTLAVRLGNNARSFGLRRNDPTRILSQQLGIYNTVLSTRGK